VRLCQQRRMQRRHLPSPTLIPPQVMRRTGARELRRAATPVARRIVRFPRDPTVSWRTRQFTKACVRLGLGVRCCSWRRRRRGGWAARHASRRVGGPRRRRLCRPAAWRVTIKKMKTLFAGPAVAHAELGKVPAHEADSVWATHGDDEAAAHFDAPREHHAQHGARAGNAAPVAQALDHVYAQELAPASAGATTVARLQLEARWWRRRLRRHRGIFDVIRRTCV